jgi:hypothetical protein
LSPVSDCAVCKAVTGLVVMSITKCCHLSSIFCRLSLLNLSSQVSVEISRLIIKTALTSRAIYQ